ncbi:MAG: hypothetical protein HY722_13850 [Planctomycetes bacterium]|nr:hypothetical protein [Planctomycetota bacterium]
MGWEVSPGRAAAVAWLAAGLNLSAALAMAWVLAPGLPVEGSLLESRMAYVSTHRPAWWLGWLLWHAAALGLVAFYLALAGLWGREAPLRTGLALLAAGAGLAADLGAETLYMAVAPGSEAAAFRDLERISGALTGYLGNGLYTVAGILLTWAGARRLPWGLVALAVPTWGAGLSLSACTLADSAAGQFWSTAALMPLFILWSAGVGLWLGGRTATGPEHAPTS